MIENYGLNIEALRADLEYRRTTRAIGPVRRPLPRNGWWRRSTTGR